jgi:copper chaperone CopZ
MTIETTHADIHGLNCPNCAAKVERAVADLPGVHGAAVEFDTEQAILEYNPSTVTIERIARMVERTGCDSNRFTLSVDGRRIGSVGSQRANDNEDGSHDDCCNDGYHRTRGHQQKRSPF